MAKKKTASTSENRNRTKKEQMGIIRRGEVYPIELFAALAAGGCKQSGLNLLRRLSVRPRCPVRGVCQVIGDEYIDALEQLVD